VASIARGLGISRSRVWQLRRRAQLWLRRRFAGPVMRGEMDQDVIEREWAKIDGRAT